MTAAGVRVSGVSDWRLSDRADPMGVAIADRQAGFAIRGDRMTVSGVILAGTRAGVVHAGRRGADGLWTVGCRPSPYRPERVSTTGLPVDCQHCKASGWTAARGFTAALARPAGHYDEFDPTKGWGS